MSYILTVEVAQVAVNMVTSAIKGFLGSEFSGGRNLYVVVLAPGTSHVLYEKSFGEGKESWQYPYDDIARSKAQICQRTSMVLRDVQIHAPWLLKQGDTKYVGGVFENGLVVAASGLKDCYDEMFLWMILSAIQGLCREQLDKVKDLAPNDNFIGE